MLFRIPSGRCVVCFVFDQSIAASDNRLSYACILLFPKSTKYLLGSPDLRYRAVAITLRQILILRRFVRYFFVQGKLHKKMS